MLLSLLFFMAAIVEVFLAFYVLLVNRRETSNRLFFVTCTLFAEWSFCYAVFVSLPHENGLLTWYRLSNIGWIAAPAFLLHFLLHISGRRGLLRRRWFLVLIYLPMLLFALRHFVSPAPALDLVRTPQGWAERTVWTPWNTAFTAYYGTASVAAFVSVFLWARRAAHRAQRLQARVIAFIGISTVALGSLFPRLSTLMTLVWLMGIGYAVARLNLMRLTLGNVAGDILRTMTDGVVLLAWDKQVLALNPAAARMLGTDKAVGKPIGELLPQAGFLAELTPEGLAHDSRPTETGGQRTGHTVHHQIERAGAAGLVNTINVSVSSAVDRFGESIGLMAVLRDVSQLRQAEEKLKFMATHDPLTGLPNRFLLADRVQVAVAQSRRHQLPLAVLLIDMDNFKAVNDTLGHAVGDELLRLFARRVSGCLRTNDTFARLGGDEFVAMLPEVKTPEDPLVVATRLLDRLREPFHVVGRAMLVTVSIGISVYPNDGDGLEALLQNADAAMYGVKQSGKSGFRFYDDVRVRAADQEALGERALAKALADGQLDAYYQPIVELDTGKVAMAEVLLRWNHPERGVLSAGLFLPIAEQSGLIVPMGEWVVRRACAQLRTWADAGLDGVPLAINVSAKQIQGFAGVVEAALSETGVKPSRLFFEITESSAMRESERSQDAIRRLSELGVRIVIDDFGSGFSSIRWLRSLPVYAIKLDRFFVQNLEGDEDNRAIMSAIVTMAHSLNLKVIAGGVETQQQVDALRSLDWPETPSLRFDHIQGYFLGRPMPAEDLARLLG